MTQGASPGQHSWLWPRITLGSCPQTPIFGCKDVFSFLPNVSLCGHPFKKGWHIFTAPASPASPHFLPIALFCPLKILNQALSMLSASPQGWCLLPSPHAGSEDRKPPVAEELAAAPLMQPALTEGCQGFQPGSTGWKQDEHAPRIQLQPLSRPLQALSSTTPKEGSRPLAKRNPLLPGPAPLASVSAWTGGAGQDARV